ncbi:MAG TPA: hypothetical protein VF144_05925 [Chitinophagaceae bacterium]
MKISPLLAQFLINNKHLNLAGLGTFTLNNSGEISFQHDAYVKEDSELVSFIAESTGKMKSLVASDLDSNLELARQFLNIGKPYLFEGIGTLSKNKSGAFEFVQANSVPEKNKDTIIEGRDKTSTTESSFTDYEEMFSPKKPKTPAPKRIATWLVALAGLSLAVFGGYLVYTKTKNKQEPIVEKEEIKPVIIPADTIPEMQDTSSMIARATHVVDSSGMYRFVIEKAAKQRALSRYNYLRENLIDVKMDTKDSVLFNLYFLLPASPADTAKKRDSLQRLYGTRGKTVVELN